MEGRGKIAEEGGKMGPLKIQGLGDVQKDRARFWRSRGLNVERDVPGSSLRKMQYWSESVSV
jgi:hypothetical protein